MAVSTSTGPVRSVGRYRLDALLGRGGMAEVWRAFDTKLERSVAVKVILASFAEDEGFLSRFNQEARLVASLEHPNILPVYDFGEEGGVPFLVMPYLDGGTLKDRMDGRPVRLSQAIEWIRQVGDALDAAHAAGVLHRDVKPANVLVGKGERLALADFGIAKMLEAVTRLTATGMVVGTPIYMAPEQAQGRPASPASDRYALAVIAYELVTGRPPFDGESALSLMHQHVSSPVPPVTGSNPSLPSSLDGYFARALAKDPAARPASGRLLAEEIAACLGTVGSAPLEPPTAHWRPTAVAGAEEGGGTGTTMLGQVEAEPPVRATPRPVSIGLTSEATVATAPAGGGGTGWGRILATTAVIVVAAGSLGIWSLRNRGKEPTSFVPARREALPSAQARPTSAAGDSVLAALVASFERAIAAGRLAPPEPDNAMEILSVMRRDFGGAPGIPASEELLVRALRLQAQSRAASGKPGAAIESLSQAVAIRPQDSDLLRERTELEARLRSAAAAAPVPPIAPAAPSGSAAPAPPRPPAPGGAADVEEPADLKEARRRLNPSLKPAKRLEKADFESALAAAEAALARTPERPDAVALKVYAKGGIAYATRNDAEAAHLLKSAWKESSRPRQNGRDAWAVLGRLLAGGAEPTGWELALAYGDARGEADTLLAKELAARPTDTRALMGRAFLERTRGQDAEALATATTAHSNRAGGPAGAGIALFLGEQCERLSRWEDAVEWYREGARAGGPVGGVAELRAGRVLRDRLGKADEGVALLKSACSDGNVEACRETGEARSPDHPGQPRPVQRRKALLRQ
jgi:serine/threonine-protein kinase